MNFLRGYLRFARFFTLTHIAGIFKIYARKSGGSFFELNLGVLRILLSPGRAESPMERLAQGKRSGTLGWVVVSKTIYALKGQKRGYCAFVSHTKCYVLSVRRFSNFFQSAMFLRFCPFRAWIFYFCLTYPGCRFACPGHPMLSTKF